MASPLRCRPSNIAAPFFLLAAALTIPSTLASGRKSAFWDEITIELLSPDGSAWCSAHGRVTALNVMEVGWTNYRGGMVAPRCQLVTSRRPQVKRSADVTAVEVRAAKGAAVVPWKAQSALIHTDGNNQNGHADNFVEVSDIKITDNKRSTKNMKPTVNNRRNGWTIGLYQGVSLDKVITVNRKNAASGKFFGRVKVKAALTLQTTGDKVSLFYGDTTELASNAAELRDVKSKHGKVVVVGPNDDTPRTFNLR